MVNGPDRRWLEKRPDLWSWTVAVVHVAAVFGAVYAAAALGPSPLVVLLWLWFGLTLSGLLNLMHECAHRLAFRRRRSSDILGRWVLGPLVLADFDGYRERHWAHHRNLGQDDDTKDAYLVDIRGPALGSLLIRCLLLRRAAGTFARQSEVPGGEGRPPTLGAAFVRIAVVQSVLIVSVMAVALAGADSTGAAVVAGVMAYGGVYLYGLSSLTVFVATLRAIAEHQVDEGAAVIEGRAALRNFAAGPFSRLVFGAYGFALHATHHREPGVPHYRLRDRTAVVAAADPVLAPTRGYLGTLRELARSTRRPGVRMRQPSDPPTGAPVPWNAPVRDA